MRRSLLQQIGSAVDNRFILEVKSDNVGTSNNDQFTIPTNGSGAIAFNYDIETSDGYTASGLTGDHTINFPSGSGTYEVYITGDFPYIHFDNVGDRLKVLDIKNYGIYGTGSTNQQDSFYGCSNMIISAIDSGNFENVTSFTRAYRDIATTSFPLIDTSSAISFGNTFFSSINLSTFPANVFDNTFNTNYNNAFVNTNLTQTSIDNILVSIATSYTNNGLSGGTFVQSGGSAPSTTGETAIDTLRAAGMTVTVTGGY